MKKFLTLLLVFALIFTIFSFTACSDDEETDDSSTNSGSEPDNSGNNDNSGDSGNGEQKPADDDLQAAFDYIKLTYKSLGTTAKSFEIMKNAPIGDKIFAITWSTNNEAITITESEDGNFYIVNVPALGESAINYTLSFSIQNDSGEKKEGSFALNVPAFAITTFEEYASAEKGATLTVQGIVTGIVSKDTGSLTNGLYLQDCNNAGGYYIYDIAELPEGIAVGVTVQATGNKALYNGNYQLASATVEIVDAEVKPVTPVDFTELFVSAPALNDATLVEKQGMLITIKGVTIREVNDKYYYFELGNKKTYVYISSSNNPTSSEALETIKQNHADNYFNSADVTGVIGLYNGELTLYPVSADCFANFTEVEKPDSFKVEQAMLESYIKSIIQDAGTITLADKSSTFEEVSIAWELIANEGVDCATIDGNVLTLTIPEEKQTITLKATFTLNEVVESKEYSVTVKGIDTISIKDVDNIVADFVKNQYTDEKFYVIGTIQQISNETYGNMYIVAIVDGEEYGVDIYGLNDADGKKYADFTGYKPQVGDTIKVVSVVGKYTNPQLKSAVLVEYNHNYVPEVTAPTCQADGFTTYKCACGDTYIDNTVPKIDCNYGEDMVCTMCGIKNHEHTTVAGETVAPTCTSKGYTVYKCSDGNCNFTENKDEVDELAHTDANGDYICDAENCGAMVAPEANSVLTIEQALALGALYGHNKYSTDKYYITGTISEISNTKYGNMILVDENGNSIATYGLYDANGLKYESFTGTKPVVGDVITVYSVVGTYNSAIQLKNPTLQHSNEEVVTAPTCTDEGYTTYTCKYCGATSVGAETEALGHNFVDGVCDREGCGALDHKHEYTDVVTEPTCTTEGYTTHTCECGDVQKDTIVPAKGHAYTDGICANGCGIDDPEYYFPMTITEALAQADGKQVKVTGTVIKINIPYDTGYKNMTVTIADGSGDTLYVYRLSADVKVNDIITITGKVGSYNGAKQIAQGATATIDGTHTCSDYTDATCQDLPECVICGTALEGGELAEHSYVDGTCSVCGHKEGAAEVITETFDIAASTGTLSGDSLSISWSSDNFDFLGEKSSSTTAIRTSDTDHFRIYQGSKFTISGKNGQKIKTIVIESTTADYATQLVNSVVTEGVTATADGKIVTITADTTVTSIEISAVKQTRVSSFEIMYEA